MTNRLFQLYEKLNDITTDDGLTIKAELSVQDVEMLRLEIQDREELPIFVTIDDEQLLCISYLWTEEEIKQERREELLEVLLTINLPMPLSAFGKVQDRYILFGALSLRASDEDVVEEISVLSDNTLNALDLVQEYLHD